MQFTQHFHGANLSHLLAEARHDASEFSQRPALPQPARFTSAHVSAVKFILHTELGAERLALALRSVSKGSWMGFGTNPATGTPVAVVCRQRPGRAIVMEA